MVIITEKLDFYDEYLNFLGTELRDVVHEKGLWHKTIHCWLFDEVGNIYFQIRADSKKLYTTASGHVLAGETIKQAFKREVFEEIGLETSTDNANMVEINVWKMEKIKNGKPFIDHAFAHVYINKIDSTKSVFSFDETEVLGVVRMNAVDCLDMLLRNKLKIRGEKITNKGIEEIQISFDDFLIFENELGILKYGKILKAVINS